MGYYSVNLPQNQKNYFVSKGICRFHSRFVHEKTATNASLSDQKSPPHLGILLIRHPEYSSVCIRSPKQNSFNVKPTVDRFVVDQLLLSDGNVFVLATSIRSLVGHSSEGIPVMSNY